MKITTLLSAVTLLVASCGVFAGGQGTVLNEAWTAMETDSAVQVDDKWDYIRFLPVRVRRVNPFALPSTLVVLSVPMPMLLIPEP